MILENNCMAAAIIRLSAAMAAAISINWTAYQATP